MLTIRLARIGKKNQAQFQIVLQEHSVAPGGRHVEVLGSYDPHQKKTVLKEERIKYWLSQGAQPSDTAYNLLVSKGILTGEKRKVKLPARNASSIADAGGPKKAEVVVEETKVEAPKKEEAPAVEEAKTEAPAEAPKEEAPVVEEKKEEIKAEEIKVEEKIEETKTEEVKAE